MAGQRLSCPVQSHPVRASGHDLCPGPRASAGLVGENRDGDSPCPGGVGCSGRMTRKNFSWIAPLLAVALVLVLMGLLALAISAAWFLRPLPTSLPAPRPGAVLGLMQLPGLGPVWVELGSSRADDTRLVLGLESLHPTFRIVPSLGTEGEWSIVQPHGSDSETVMATMTWDGRAFLHRPSGDPGHSVRIAPHQVGGIEVLESASGMMVLGRGNELSWSSRRPVWWDAGVLDRAVDEDIRRGDLESWDEFFDTFRWMVGSRPWLSFLNDSSTHGVWPCERRRVIYHRSARAVSLLHVCHRNLGGVHGNNHMIPLNLIEGPSGVERLDFAGLFRQRSGWQDTVRRWLWNDLSRQRASWTRPETGAPPEDPMKPGHPLHWSDEELATLRFTVSPDGVFVHFEEYEAGTYAEGAYVVLLPWRVLAPWVRPEVLEALRAKPVLPDIRLEGIELIEAPHDEAVPAVARPADPLGI